MRREGFVLLPGIAGWLGVFPFPPLCGGVELDKDCMVKMLKTNVFVSMEQLEAFLPAAKPSGQGTVRGLVVVVVGGTVSIFQFA